MAHTMQSNLNINLNIKLILDFCCCLFVSITNIFYVQGKKKKTFTIVVYKFGITLLILTMIIQSVLQYIFVDKLEHFIFNKLFKFKI